MLDTFADFNIPLPPTQKELPYDDGEPMETQRHKLQLDLLMDALQSSWLTEQPDRYVGGNMFVYYSMEQVRNRDFKGPDLFVVLDVPNQERLSWVVWEEGKAPDVVIELLSDSTATQDKTHKKQIYQDRMRVPEYFWFDPFNPEDWAGFTLSQGAYQPIAPNDQNQLVSQVLELALVRWHGNYKGIETTWLRWATRSGELLLTGQEWAEQEKQRAEQEKQRAEQEKQRAEQEKQRAEQEKQRAEQTEAQLKQVISNLVQSGMTIEQAAQMTGLPVQQVQTWLLP